jgi:hypothetical protein
MSSDASDPFHQFIGKRLYRQSELPPASSSLTEGVDYFIEASISSQLRQVLSSLYGGSADEQAMGGIRILDEKTIVTAEYRKERWNINTKEGLIKSIRRG